MFEEYVLWTVIAIMGGIVMYIILRRSVFEDPHETIYEKVPVLAAFTSVFAASVLVFTASTLGGWLLFITLLMAIGMIGLAFVYAYGGSALRLISRPTLSSIGEAVGAAGVLHLSILLGIFMNVLPTNTLPLTSTNPLPLAGEFVQAEVLPTVVIIVLIAILAFITNLFLVAVPEELFARGFLTHGLGVVMPWYFVLPFSSAVWVFLHALTRIPAGAGIALAFIMVGGLVLMYLSGKYSLFEAVIMHALYNAVIEVTVAAIVLAGPLWGLMVFMVSAFMELGLGATLYLRGEGVVA